MCRTAPLVFALAATFSAPAAAQSPRGVSQADDWLVSVAPPTPTTLIPSPDGTTLTLANGLLTRTFAYGPSVPCFTTVDYGRADTGQTFFRALSPEVTLTLNGAQANVGSCLDMNPYRTPQFFDPTQAVLVSDPLSLVLINVTSQAPSASFPWTPGSWFSPSTLSWPPKGLHVTALFTPPAVSPNNASHNFSTYAGIEFGCPDGGSCLTGWPTCDNNTVQGQCTWPAATAAASCAAWPACAGVTCNSARTDCQARAAPFVFTPNAGFSSTVRTGPHPAFGALVGVHYEVYDGLPALKKWVTVQTGTAPGSVLSIVVDQVTNENLRAPNFAPDQMTVLEVMANNPTPATQQVVPEATQSYGGRTQRFWYFDPEWDSCCDTELHVPYTYYTRLQAGYEVDVYFGGPTGPGALVTPSNPWAGEASRFVLHDTTDWDRQGVAIRKVQSVIAPQLTATPLTFMMTDISSSQAFQLALSQASQAGIDLAIVGYGAAGYCGMCPGQVLNATWVAWFAQQVAFGAALTPPVRVSAYTLMQMNGWGENVPEAEQILNRDGSRGPIACFATDFHAAYRQSILDFAKAVGLSGVETDGQYENAACMDDTGDHHHNGLIGSWDAQIQVTANFNAAMKGLGIYQTGADAYWMSGANRWNHADTDAGYNLPRLWDRINVGRDYVYDSSTTRLSTSGGYGLNGFPEATKQCDPFPGRLLCFDYGLASFLGQGVVPTVVDNTLWDPTDPDAPSIISIYRNWSTFFALHRPILISVGISHIFRPTTRGVEATAFLTADPAAPERVFVAVFNPTNTTLATARIPVSVYYAGIAPGTSVTISQVSPHIPTPIPIKTATVGSDGAGIFEVSIPASMAPTSYAFFTVQPA